MNDTSQDLLKQYAASKGVFFTPPRGKAVEVVYMKAEMVRSHWDRNKNVPRYHVLDGGVLKYWDRPSKDLAAQMSQFKPHTKISILMDGEKTETKYTITEVAS